MKIKNVKITTPELKKTNHDLNWKRFKAEKKKSCKFGPLHSNKIDKQIINPEKKVNFTNMMTGVLKDENKIEQWIEKLKRGYVPETSEIVEMQTLVYENTKKLQLMSKLIETLQSTLKRLKQTQI